MTQSRIYPHGLRGRTIRLLAIVPGEPDTPIVCTLTETSLDETSIPYNALSYCWGADRSPVQITCNSQPLSVTPNLHAALYEYRRRAVTTPLWVDAVCIDQSNISERTAQVRMMQNIYSSAACVIVWLGEAEPNDSLALELLKAINAPWATFHDSSRNRDIPLFTGQNISDHDAIVAAQASDAYFDALAAFLLRPWFSRIWIVQEIVSASQLAIWCGTDTLNEDFPLFEASARLLQMNNCNTKTQLATTVLKDKDAQGIGRSKLMSAGRLWGFKTFRDMGLTGILWYLMITRCFDSTDPRDKIFALVGLASDVGEEFVDYSKSYEDVIHQLSHMLLDGTIPANESSALDIWSCITRNENDNLEGPSWVVDWLKLRDSLYTPLMSQYQSERPVMQRQSEITFTGSGKTETLHVRGVVFDTVSHIVPSPIAMRQLVPQSEFLTFQHMPGIIDWHSNAIQALAPLATTDEIPLYPPTGEPLYTAFWRTLCCNGSSSHESRTPLDDSSYIQWQNLLAMQNARHAKELTYRRVCRTWKRLSLSIAAFSLTALTYRFRHHKFLFVAIPFTIPSLLRFISTAWDSAQLTLLMDLFKEYMVESTGPQIAQRDFENSHSLWTQGRQFGITDGGRMGWMPVAAKVGDCVGLFAGCRVPFVLRGGLGGWKIVGDAYLHGVMEGEGETSEGEMLKIL